MNAYLWLKSLHLVGVVLFLGNIVVTGWWKLMADRTRDPRIIAFAQRQVTLTDWVFTGGGVLLLLGSGNYAILLQDMDLRGTPWLLWGNALLLLSGLLWVAVLIPVQAKQARMSRGFSEAGAIPQHYWKLCRIWYLVGSAATLLPAAALLLMVLKPV